MVEGKPTAGDGIMEVSVVDENPMPANENMVEEHPTPVDEVMEVSAVEEHPTLEVSDVKEIPKFLDESFELSLVEDNPMPSATQLLVESQRTDEHEEEVFATFLLATKRSPESVSEAERTSFEL